MAACTICITYPDDNAKLPTADSTYTLPATVTDSISAAQVDLSNCKILQDGKELNLKKYLIPLNPIEVQFDAIPVKYTSKYEVQVADDKGNTDKHAFQFVEPPKTGGSKHRVELGNPSAPLPNSTVTGSGFWVQVPSDLQVPIYAVMFQPGGPSYIGMMGTQPPNCSFYFQNIPSGSNYMIYITEWTSPPQTAVITNITVT